METYKVPDELENKYHGCGYALAATVDGRIIDIVYLADLLPEFDGEQASAQAAIDDVRIVPKVRELQALGEVHLGMLSCWEFVQL